MFEILNIPLPVLPGGALGMLLGALAMLAGVLLLSLGRVVVWRLIAAACLGGLGLPIAGWLAARTDFSELWLMLGAVAVMAAIGLAAARLCWAAYVATIAAAAALLGVVHNIMPAEATGVPAGFAAAELTFGQWSQLATQTLGDWLKWMMNRAAAMTLAAGGVAALAGLAAGMLKPMATRIVATSVTGAAMCLAGACMAASSVKGDIDFCVGHRPYGLLAIGSLAALAGIVYQTRSHLRNRGDGGKAEKADNDKDDQE